MAVVCPRCSNIYEPHGPCTRCGAHAPTRDNQGTAPVRGPRWQQTPWGRILIGLILTQGMFYGLRHLLTGVLLAVYGTVDDLTWDNLQLLLILQTIQLLSVLFGGLLAGGGQSAGLILGAVVGIGNGLLAAILKQNPAQAINLVGLYGLPALHSAVGMVGGAMGSFIWKPIPSTPVPVNLSPMKKVAPKRKTNLLAGPFAWFRIFSGSAFAVAGTLSATAVLEKVIEVSNGKLGTTTGLQDLIITWELKALSILVGSTIAGATTRNGLKQGLGVALATSAVLIGIQAPLSKNWLELSFFTFIGTTSLALVGGWFGGQLFPPVVRRDRRRY